MSKIKKTLSVILASMFVFSCSTVCFGAETDDIKIYIDGEIFQSELTPQMINGKVYVAVRPIYEKLGIEFSWYNTDTDKYITSSKNGNTVTLFVDKDYYTSYKDGDEFEQITYIDANPLLIDERIYVPARYIVEPLGYEISWNGAEKAVRINSSAQGSPELSNNPLPSPIMKVFNNSQPETVRYPEVIEVDSMNLKNPYCKFDLIFRNHNGESITCEGKITMNIINSKDKRVYHNVFDFSSSNFTNYKELSKLEIKIPVGNGENGIDFGDSDSGILYAFIDFGNDMGMNFESSVVNLPYYKTNDNPNNILK